MISKKVLRNLEYDKILEKTSNYAVLNKTKNLIKSSEPTSSFKSAQLLLDKTEQAVKLLFEYNISGVNYYDEIDEQLLRCQKGGVLTFGELLSVSKALASFRILKNSILKTEFLDVNLLKEVAERIYTYEFLEKDINSKIISEDTIADTASEKLFNLRKTIKSLNVKIRDTLLSYMRGEKSEYLQDNIVTMRNGRYVVPVKSESRSFVKGFIHDQSQSGATVFIEPDAVIELNNELKTKLIEEENEIQRILAELSSKISTVAENLFYNDQNTVEIDCYFAKAIYAYKTNSIKPVLSSDGKINIVKGRHPLINKEKVVPVSLSLGVGYSFILLSGPNTGGKTVTLKLTGLFTAMASSGFFVPAVDGTVLSIFSNVYCDIGDDQSIEEDLSTFSSHMKNLIEIIENLTDNSLILIDEIGAGTDPEEGSALALAIIEKLLSKNCYGIITTHYTKLKEYAYGENKLQNASMEFDSKTFAPLYKLSIGVPGASNAIEISKRLGLSEAIIENAISFLSSDKISFEKVLKETEIARQTAKKETERLSVLTETKEKELNEVLKLKQSLQAEKDNISKLTRAEVRKGVNDRLDIADDIIEELKNLLKKENLSSVDIITAKSLKNKLDNVKYFEEKDEEIIERDIVEINKIKVGDKVFSKSLNIECIINKIYQQKNKVEVVFGNMRAQVEFSDLYKPTKEKEVKKSLTISKKVDPISKKSVLNIIGKNILEGITELELFIDGAVLKNESEIMVIHGVGTGKLKNAVWEYLKKDKRISEFRSGKYGEGEKGVTVITLKWLFYF